MWFLTHEGVDRYNGKQYTHYELNDEEKTIQHFPNLSHLHIDDAGGVWVLGKNGYVFKYNPYSDKYDLMMSFVDSIHTTRQIPLTHIRMDKENDCGYVPGTINTSITQSSKHSFRWRVPSKKK